jgi:anti-sigma regulatory factor (Ser/Thr protein kinase)
VVSEQAGFFRIRFTADPVELIFFRGGLNRWLLGLQWPDVDRHDAVLAVSEACDNSVQHAYSGAERGEVEVVARVMIGSDDRRIVAVVRDHGHLPGSWGDRGLGLTMLHACMDRVQIRRAEGGTMVTMTSRPVPLLDTANSGDDGG